MLGTADSGTGKINRRRLFCDSRMIGIACVCEAVPAWIIAPTLAYRFVTTPLNGAQITVYFCSVCQRFWPAFAMFALRSAACKLDWAADTSASATRSLE